MRLKLRDAKEARTARPQSPKFFAAILRDSINLKEENNFDKNISVICFIVFVLAIINKLPDFR